MPDRIQQLLDRAELRRTLTRFLTEAGYFLYLNGSHEKAAEVLLGARAADSRDPVPIIAYAEVMLATGRAGKAERAAQQACDRAAAASHDSMPFAWLVRGDALMARRKPTRAAQAWRHAAELDAGQGVGIVAADRLRQLDTGGRGAENQRSEEQ